MPSLRLSPPHTVVNSVEGSFSISGREISVDVWSRREPDIVNRDGGRRIWVETGSIRLASVSQLGDQVSFHISFLALYSSS